MNAVELVGTLSPLDPIWDELATDDVYVGVNLSETQSSGLIPISDEALTDLGMLIPRIFIEFALPLSFFSGGSAPRDVTFYGSGFTQSSHS